MTAPSIRSYMQIFGIAVPAKNGSYRAKKLKIDFFTKTVFLTIQVDIGEVWRFPG